jgi:hypothetical protein
MHTVKHIGITACEGPPFNHFIYKDKLFTSYKDVDSALRQLAPRDENLVYKCYVHIVFDDDTSYVAKLELGERHRVLSSILLPHVISHCEVMSGRVIPPAYRFDVDKWTTYLDEVEKTKPALRAHYAQMLDEYFA